MTTAALLTALLQFGPTILPLLVKLVGDIQAGKGGQTVTLEDLQELNRLASQTGEDIYARFGITPPSKIP